MRAMRRLLALLVLTTATPAHADWPPPEGADLSQPANWPNDPGYDGQWNLWSWMPSANVGRVSDYEASVGSGIHADRAWQRTTGRPEVIIAVLDSGIRWGDLDLVNKFYLSRGELPVPAAGCGVNALDPHDANGDGVFNVKDYDSCDPAVSDLNENGVIDPQDLIRAFSDGTDDDANGWVDDISGWDAFHDDNDPSDDTDFGHGTGEAKDSAAETDNGIGDAGVCPRCTVLMVRVGDSFVVDANDFATGVVFGVDSGAQVIQEALGSINGTPAMYEAIEYAYVRGATVVASAADEDSFHANLPGSVNHTIYVHATTHDTNDRDDASTFMAFNNCTNYGAQLLLSTPGEGCSSEATGKTSGVVGLMVSAGIEAGLAPLKPEEIKQLLLTTVDDIYDPGDATDPLRYVTYPGWEKRFGYGRTNVRNAVDAIFASKIPPVVDVRSPDWFDVIDTEAGTVAIDGEISYRDALYDSYDYVVEWAPGIEPGDDDWTTLAEGTNETQPIDGSLATFDAADLAVDNPPMPEPDVNAHRYLVTVRVRVTLHATGMPQDGTRGEIRRAFHVRHDDDVVAGFPVQLAASGEASAKITDLDGDGAMELVTADSAGAVHVLGADGTARPGWPQHTDTLPAWAATSTHRDTAAVADGLITADAWRTPVLQGPAVGDLDGDGGGGKMIVVASWDGEIYVWDAAGNLADGFPVGVDERPVTGPDRVVDRGIFGSPVLADLDGDGALEIIAAAMDARLYAWHRDGARVAGFPVLLQDGDQLARSVQTPSVGDIDGDGAPEIVVGTNEFYGGLGALYAVHGDGSYVDGWPVRLPTQDVLPVVGVGLPNNTALADIDGDGVLDVAACGIVALPQFVKGDGTLLGIVHNSPFGANTTSDDSPSFIAIANGTIADLDRDRSWDVIWGGAGLGFAEAFAGAGRRVDIDHQVGAWSTRTLEFLPGFPQRVEDHQFFMNPAVADLDDDGYPEVISGSGGYFLHAFDHTGAEPEGWPKFTGGWIISSPAVGDLDGDGTLEVVAATREGYLWAWHTQGRTDGRVDWASFHHDDGNTGNVDTPIGFGESGLDDETGGGGGCCDAGGGSPVGTAVVVFAACIVLLRPRRWPR
jgi:hypothetical protein